VGRALECSRSISGPTPYSPAHVCRRSASERNKVLCETIFKKNVAAVDALLIVLSVASSLSAQVVVHFRNGGDEVLPAGAVVRSGGRTRAIPLKGGARQISSVEIWYQKGKYNEGKPRVDLFGRH
jgi:hypothetical protein